MLYSSRYEVQAADWNTALRKGSQEVKWES